MGKGPQQRVSSGASKKSKKDDSEDFQAFCSELAKATSKKKPEQHPGPKESAAQIAAKGAMEAPHPLEKMLEHQARQRKLQTFLSTMMAAERQRSSAFLSKPDTTFVPEKLVGKHFASAAGSMQGWRAVMEDQHILDVDFLGAEREGCGLFAVFDGHAGQKCAQINKVLMPVFAKKHFNAATGSIGFENAFADLDNAMRAKGLPDESGSTAVVVFVTPTHVTCASVGDSRAVLCRGGKCVSLSFDHKPNNELEKLRITAAGGHTENNRVNGQLAMSRALGDYMYKRDATRPAHEQLVTNIPDVIRLDRTKEDLFLVVACDGIFDVLSNEAVVEFVHQQLQEDPTQELTNICHKLCNRCLAPASSPSGQPCGLGTDNMTVVIVKL